MLLLGMILVLIAFSSFVAIKLLHQDVPRKAQELETSVNLSAEAEKNFTVSERVLLWKASMNMIWDNDWAGVGAGNWKIFFPAYGSDIWRARQGMVQFQRPHNDFIWLIAELGILGLLSYLAIFTIILFAALRSIANPLLEQGDRVFIKLLFSGLIAYLVIAFFSFPRERIFHQVVLYLSFAFILRQQASEIVWRFKMIIFPFSAVITGLAAFSFGLNYWRSESTMLKVNQARAEGNWQELVLQHNKLADNYFYQIDAVSIPTSFYAGLAHLNLQNYPVSERYFEEAYALHPYNIHVINNLANIKLLSAKADAAAYYYRKALAVSPKYLEGALNLMAAYFNTNQVKKAYSVLCEYERVFAVDNPNHPSLQTYRLTILRAMQDLTIKSGLDWIFLEDQELEKRHFKSLESGDVLFFK
jgi:tetratricopeptide (TPR) repeat protein